jgi:hypothetical protein
MIMDWTKIAIGGLGVAIVAGVYSIFRRSSVVILTPDCSIAYAAAHHGGKRSMANVRLIVLHSTEGSTAKGAASWFANPASAGSTQLVVDDRECYRTLPDDVVPYGAPGANEDGLHIEMAGFAKWTRAQWLEREDTIRRAAAFAADWSNTYGIPLVYVDAAGLKRKESGVTTHWQVTKGLNGGVGHVDPGPNFPLDVFMRYAGGVAPPDGSFSVA